MASNRSDISPAYPIRPCTIGTMIAPVVLSRSGKPSKGWPSASGTSTSPRPKRFSSLHKKSPISSMCLTMSPEASAR